MLLRLLPSSRSDLLENQRWPLKKNDFQEPRWPSRCFQQFSSGGASVGCQSFNQAGQGTRSGDRQVRKSFLHAGGFEQQAEIQGQIWQMSVFGLASNSLDNVVHQKVLRRVETCDGCFRAGH